MQFVLAEAYGNGFQEDAYMDADMKLESEFNESWYGLKEWLEENIDNYMLDTDYRSIDSYTIHAAMLLVFKEGCDATAFKLTWL